MSTPDCKLVDRASPRAIILADYRMDTPLEGWQTVETQPVAGGDVTESAPDPETLRARLRTNHREILRRVFLGEQLTDVASAVGIPYASVKYIVKSPLFQAALAEMQAEADGKVIDTAQRMRMERELSNAAEAGIPIAFRAMKESQSPATRAKIAFGFLDRAGLSPSRKVEEKREGFREMLERLDEIERHTAAGTEVTAEIKFSVRKEGEAYRGNPVDKARSVGDPSGAGSASQSSEGNGAESHVDPASFLRRALG